jgi:hypothetical protein
MKYSDKQNQFLIQDFCKIFVMEGSHNSLASTVTRPKTGRSDVQFPAEVKRLSPPKSPDVTGAHSASYSMRNDGKGAFPGGKVTET